MGKNIVLVFMVLVILGCSNNKDYRNSSRATGWKMIGRMGGFAKNYNEKAKAQETGPGLVFIEGGTFTMGRVQDDPMKEYTNIATQQHVMSFYMDETEVTNLMYLEYLDWLKRIFPPQDPNYKHIYSSALPDTLVWRNSLGQHETLVLNYLRHPAYSNYPVVGVSWLQSVNFCKWRTNRVNESILAQEKFTSKTAKYNATSEKNFNLNTYLQVPSEVYGGDNNLLNGGKRSSKILKLINDSIINQKRVKLYMLRRDGHFLPRYRLPTEAEWEYAALGMNGIREYNLHKGRKKYPWTGKYTSSKKRKNRGDQLANFKQGSGDYSGIPGWGSDNADITAPVKSYLPNAFGLYDMAGNVAEWVADVYRQDIEDNYNDFNYYRGNVYTKYKKDSLGNYSIVDKNTIKYDTLPNGELFPKYLPGDLEEIPVDETETYLRINFSQSNNTNYLNGDKNSLRKRQNFDFISVQMYNAPRHFIRIDSNGKIVRKFDSTSKRTTLVSNKVRVYKGGSWKDGEYWLDPAQRRYLTEYMATDFIGFRCAMSRVGKKSKSKKSKS